MPGKAKGLSPARAAGDPPLGATGAELMDFLVRQVSHEPLKPDDVTITRLAEKAGSTLDMARRLLNREVKAGRLVKVQCQNAIGKLEFAFRLPSDGPRD